MDNETYNENGIYNGPDSEYNEFGIDTRTGAAFYGIPPRTLGEALEYYAGADLTNAINTAKKEAKAEGKAEVKKETARRMKSKGFSETDIAEITGLCIEEIKAL